MTSDCLSRLEGDEQTTFSEETIREVSGNMFSGELPSRPHTPTRVLTVGYSCSRDSMLGTRPSPPITSLTPLLDKDDFASVLLSNGSQPRRHEESAGGT